MAIENLLEYDQRGEINERPYNMPVNHDHEIASIPVDREVSDDIDDADDTQLNLHTVPVYVNRRSQPRRRYRNGEGFGDVAEGHHQRPHPSRDIPPTAERSIRDGMGRVIQTGDVLTWNSGGYYSNFWSFGIVKSINRDHGRIRVINHKEQGVNIWVTMNTVIIAKRDNWDSIPHDYLVKFGVV